MSLLCVCVKAAYLDGPPEKFNSYVTLKLQNVKSTTVAVKGNQPLWEQDFMFETNQLNVGLVVELWTKGLIWDTLLGTALVPLRGIKQSSEEGSGEWFSLDREVEVKNRQVNGTKMPTGHRVLIDARYEVPFEQEESVAYERKLRMIHDIIQQDASGSGQQPPAQLIPAQSGMMSEDSDYTSDVNAPTVSNSSPRHSGGTAHHSSDRLDSPSHGSPPSRFHDFNDDRFPGMEQPYYPHDLTDEERIGRFIEDDERRRLYPEDRGDFTDGSADRLDQDFPEREYYNGYHPGSNMDHRYNGSTGEFTNPEDNYSGEYDSEFGPNQRGYLDDYDKFREEYREGQSSDEQSRYRRMESYEQEEYDRKYHREDSPHEVYSDEYEGREREFVHPDREYVAPDREYVAPDREYVAPDREYVAPDREYVPPDGEFEHPGSEDIEYDKDKGAYDLRKGEDLRIGDREPLRIGDREPLPGGRGSSYDLRRDGDLEPLRGSNYDLRTESEYESRRGNLVPVSGLDSKKGSKYDLTRDTEYDMHRDGDFDLGLEGKFDSRRNSGFDSRHDSDFDLRQGREFDREPRPEEDFEPEQERDFELHENIYCPPDAVDDLETRDSDLDVRSSEFELVRRDPYRNLRESDYDHRGSNFGRQTDDFEGYNFDEGRNYVDRGESFETRTEQSEVESETSNTIPSTHQQMEPYPYSLHGSESYLHRDERDVDSLERESRPSLDTGSAGSSRYSSPRVSRSNLALDQYSESLQQSDELLDRDRELDLELLEEEDELRDLVPAMTIARMRWLNAFHRVREQIKEGYYDGDSSMRSGRVGGLWANLANGGRLGSRACVGR